MEHATALSIPPLISGGVMLSYRCTNTCRHCLYRCSPQSPDEWMTMETARTIFSALQREQRLHSVHLAGGEATLRMDLLVDVVALASETGIPLAYLETNAIWCVDEGKTRTVMRRLADAGLPAVLVSASMYHNEFVPFARTKMCVEIAHEVFGRGGVIVWVQHVYDALEAIGQHDRTHTLEEFCALTGLADRPQALPGLYGLTVGGRVCSALRDCFVPQAGESYRNCTCRRELTSTSHFHIDPGGRLFTGTCAGIVPATSEDFHPAISAASHPVFTTLCGGGPWALAELAARQCAFKPREQGYVSKCDLCLDARGSLERLGTYSELAPAGFYRTA
ncbi:MAG: radical SAM protein [Planctomycetaceae bacterium]|nr:radical SAM protein [Planctomycetaceae bacterium]